MVKIQIGENIINLSQREIDLFYDILTKHSDTIRNSPTIYAIYNWLREIVGNTPSQPSPSEYFKSINLPDETEQPADPWSSETNEDEFIRSLIEQVFQNKR